MSVILSVFLAILIVNAACVFATTPVKDLHVLLRGKKYDVSDSVTTVQELQERVEEISGVTADQQGKVLFGGKKLKSDDILSAVGVDDGSQLNIVPAGAETAASSNSLSDSAAAIEEYLKQAGIDTDKLDDLVKGMGGGEGGGGMPSIKESIEMMTNMMNSPLIKEYMSDPEKIEQSRQMIVNIPMLMSMMAACPEMEEILNDPDAWREEIQAAASLYQSMDTDQIMNAMMAGADPSSAFGGLGGAGAPGLFDGTLDNSAAAAALDELDEDD